MKAITPILDQKIQYLQTGCSFHIRIFMKVEKILPNLQEQWEDITSRYIGSSGMQLLDALTEVSRVLPIIDVILRIYILPTLTEYMVPLHSVLDQCHNPED